MRIFKSIRTKLAFSTVSMLLVISTTLLAVSYFTYKNAMNEQYATVGDNIARTSISMLENYDIKSYVDSLGKVNPEEIIETEEYQEMIKMLRGIKDSNDILYLYMTVPTETGAYYVFDTDEGEEACPYGYFMEYYEGEFSEQVQAFLRGETIEPIITNQEYGWIISVSYPYFSGDDFLGYVCVDVSMDEVVQERQDYLFESLLLMIGITTLFAVVHIFVLNKSMVSPVKAMAEAAKKFISSKEDEEGTSSILSLKVNTGDELEQLCTSMKKMESDINYYIKNLTAVTAEKERIGAELDVAKHIQASMLPCIFPPFPERHEFDIYATMTPAKEVGGDFYDFFLVDDNHLAMVMADVSGKGVPAALFMMISKTLIKSAAQAGLSPKEVLEKVNNQLCENNKAEMFVTVWLGILEISTGKMICANAGHEYPAIKRKDGSFELFKDRHGFVLAGMENARYKEYELELAKGDSIFVYTDGVAEATNSGEELYGTERMINALNKQQNISCESLLEIVHQDVDEFVAEAPQFDDITMLCLEFGERMEEKPWKS